MRRILVMAEALVVALAGVRIRVARWLGVGVFVPGTAAQGRYLNRLGGVRSDPARSRYHESSHANPV